MTMDPISLAVVLALMALVPLAAVLTTSFVKIAVVMMLLRNALGVQQIPPNMALYALALILSAYVMGPVIVQVGEELKTVSQTEQFAPSSGLGPAAPAGSGNIASIVSAVERGVEPLRAFMMRHSDAEHREFFVNSARELWGDEQAAKLRQDDLLVLVPAFLLSELTAAFKLGFLLYLPFVVIDLIVSNILLAMGMMMVSPITISMPLKLFLFVMVDGWTRLIQGLVLSYV